MKKSLLQMLSLLITIMLLVGCSSTEENQNQTNDNSNNTEQSAEEKAVITISQDEGDTVLTEKEVSFEEGAILMDVLKENFEIEETGGMITAVDGLEADESEKKAWMYFVNDEMPMVGAAEFELSAGDKVNLDLQSWE
ncbi:DUF4430 domain-containing protein [Ornithinibacillus sp. 4-3]|uniref:DUF4430 domain-containing protein n=1 Tax=Ornithinibacillus sp. 4-3 TaxID=3231488 RepID=A0AB39HIQ8_9BACI